LLRSDGYPKRVIRDATNSMERPVDRDSIIKDPAHGNKAEAFEAFDDIPTNPISATPSAT